MSNYYVQGYVNVSSPFHREAEKIANSFETEVSIDANGVVRWNSNHSIPPKEVMEFWQFLNKTFNLEESLSVQKKEVSDFFKGYRNCDNGPNAEQMAEIRSNFCKGSKVVNLISGFVVEV